MEYLHSQVYQFGKLFQTCKAATEYLLGENGENEFYREVTFLRLVETPEVLEVHEVPLSDEVRLVPDAPTTTNVLFPQVIPLRLFVVPEVLEVHVVPVEELRIVPEEPTITYKQVEQNSVVSLKAQDSKDGIVAEIPRLLYRFSMLLRIAL